MASQGGDRARNQLCYAHINCSDFSLRLISGLTCKAHPPNRTSQQGVNSQAVLNAAQGSSASSTEPRNESSSESVPSRGTSERNTAPRPKQRCRAITRMGQSQRTPQVTSKLRGAAKDWRPRLHCPPSWKSAWLNLSCISLPDRAKRHANEQVDNS